jgi:tyrosyl-tRNA synthetase
MINKTIEFINNFTIKGHTIEEIAESIIKNKQTKNIFPGTKELREEIDERIATYADKGTYYKVKSDSLDDAGSRIDQEIKAIFSDSFNDDLLKDLGIDNTKAEEIAKLRDGVTRENVAQTLNSIRSVAENEKLSEGINVNVQPQLDNELRGFRKNPSTVINGIGKTNYILNVPRAYYSNPDKKVRNSRIAATAGAYATVAVGGRLLSGGSLTRDNYGKKDIVGIPFV